MTQNGGEHPDNEDAINTNLKKVYDDVLNQEVPDRFKDLLEQLKSQDKSSDNSDNGSRA